MAEYLGDGIPGVIFDHNFCTGSDTATNGTLSPLLSGAATVYKTNATIGATIGLTLTANVYVLPQSNPHHIRIDTGAAATFYVGACDYGVVLTGGSVGTTSVIGSPICTFSLTNRAPLQNSTTGTGSVNVTAINSSTSAASAASFFTNDTSNLLKVSPQINGQVLFNPTAGTFTLLNGGATGTANFSSLIVQAGTITLTTLSVSGTFGATNVSWNNFTVSGQTVLAAVSVLGDFSVSGDLLASDMAVAGSITTGLFQPTVFTAPTFNIGGGALAVAGAGSLTAAGALILTQNATNGRDGTTVTLAASQPAVTFASLTTTGIFGVGSLTIGTGTLSLAGAGSLTVNGALLTIAQANNTVLLNGHTLGITGTTITLDGVPFSSGGGGATALDVWNFLIANATMPGSTGVTLAGLVPGSPVDVATELTDVRVNMQ